MLLLFFPKPAWYCTALPPPLLLPLPLLLPGELFLALRAASSTWRPTAVSLKLPSALKDYFLSVFIIIILKIKHEVKLHIKDAIVELSFKTPR